MRKTFESRREEVTGDWGKLHREDLQDLYTSPYTYYEVDQEKAGEMGRACCMCVGEDKCIHGFWLDNLKERGKLKDLVIDGKIILGQILKK
jgi:hypothetical protein